MGNIFSMGFGPFRWVCTSGLAEDLQTSDRLAGEQLERLLKRPDLPMPIRQQFEDNLRWIKQAQHHKLVVGSQVGCTRN